MNGQPLPNIHGGPVRLIIPGWPGSVSSKWLTRIWVRDKVHDGPGMGGTSYRVAIKPMVPGDRPDEKNFRDLESMPVRSIITSPMNGTSFGKDVREVKLRGAAWAGDLTVRRVDVSIDFGATWQQARLCGAEEPLRLAALDRDGEAAERGLLRDLDAGDRFARHHAAAYRRQLESAGLWRQSDAPDRDPRRMSTPDARAVDLRTARIGQHLAARGRSRSRRRPRPSRRATRSPEDYPAGAGREQTFYACTPCHGFKIVAQQGQTRRQWDDTLDWMTQRHSMPRPSDNERKIVLDYLEAAFPPRAHRAAGRIHSRNERRLRNGLKRVRTDAARTPRRTLPSEVAVALMTSPWHFLA